MFTGIIETLGLVEAISNSGDNMSYQIKAQLTPELKIDQSLAHDGVCLTVELMEGNIYQVTAIAETISKTNLTGWKIGSTIYQRK